MTISYSDINNYPPRSISHQTLSHTMIYRRIAKNKEKGGKCQAGRSLISE